VSLCIPSVTDGLPGDKEAVSLQSADDNNSVEQRKTFVTTVSDTESQNSLLLSALSQHVASFVDIRWKMVSICNVFPLVIFQVRLLVEHIHC